MQGSRKVKNTSENNERRPTHPTWLTTSYPDAETSSISSKSSYQLTGDGEFKAQWPRRDPVRCACPSSPRRAGGSFCTVLFFVKILSHQHSVALDRERIIDSNTGFISPACLSSLLQGTFLLGGDHGGSPWDSVFPAADLPATRPRGHCLSDPLGRSQCL